MRRVRAVEEGFFFEGRSSGLPWLGCASGSLKPTGEEEEETCHEGRCRTAFLYRGSRASLFHVRARCTHYSECALRTRDKKGRIDRG